MCIATLFALSCQSELLHMSVSAMQYASAEDLKSQSHLYLVMVLFSCNILSNMQE